MKNEKRTTLLGTRSFLLHWKIAFEPCIMEGGSVV